MTQINLLPWREQARLEKKLNFFVMLFLFIGATIVLEIILHLIMVNRIGYQERSNNYLEYQLQQEQAVVTQLNKRKKEGFRIYSKLQLLYKLKDRSYKAVRLLDTLARIMPDGVALTKIKREEDHVTLIGKSKSNLQVTQLMENISKSGIFRQPVLTEIARKQNEIDEKNFQIAVVQWK